MKRLKLVLIILLGFFASPSCQSLSKNSGNKPVLPNGDPWFSSARTGDWSQLENLQKQTNRDWDFKSANGMTVLMIAARNGQLDFIKNLFKKNVKVNLVDNNNYNALSYSIHGPTPLPLKEKTCVLLVQNGADAFAEDLIQLTPIQIMIEYGFSDCIKLVQLTVTKPCDQASRLPHIKSLVTYAEKEEEPKIAAYLKSQGCQ